MKVMQNQLIRKSSLNGSDKYSHEVFLTDVGDGFEVKVIRYNNWGIGKNEVAKHKKTSPKEAEELYDWYLAKLKETV